MRKTKLARTGLTLTMLTLGALFISKPTPVQASAGTTYTAAPSTTFKVVVQMDKTVKNPKVTSSNKKALKIVKYNAKKKKITITFKAIKTGTYKATVKSNGKTKTIKVKIAKSNINKTAPNNITLGSSNLSLGSSLAEVQSLLENAGMTLTDQSKGVNSYDTDCYYYFNEEDSVGCLVEFYNGTLDRVVFGAKDWSFGKLSNSTKLKDVATSSNSIGNVSGSENYSYKSHTESYSNSTFTMYYDNKEEWKSPGWCLCEWKSSANHSGSNSLKGKTVAMKRDLSKYDLNSDLKLKKSAVVDACKNMDAMAIESGKQSIYLQNLYRVYHGLGTTAYSSDLTELAYVNAYARSKLSVDRHLQAFDGKLQNNIIRDVGHTIRVNEWWVGVSQNISENAGSGMTSPLDEALTTIASTPHLETMLDGNFAAGSAIIDGYSNFESVGNSKMNIEAIAEAQEKFLNQYDLGISASEVSAGLYHDTYMTFTFENTYELTYLSKEEWVDFILDKYEMGGYPGAEEYVNIAYGELTRGLCNSVYDGYDEFMDEYKGKIVDDELTQPQLEEVYLHFCKQVYDTDFTNALASRFSCSEKDVYTKHSDVLVELNNLSQQYSGVGDYGTWIEQQYIAFSTKYNISLKSVYYMLAQYDVLTGVSSAEEMINFCSNYVDTTGFEKLYNLSQ